MLQLLYSVLSALVLHCHLVRTCRSLALSIVAAAVAAAVATEGACVGGGGSCGMPQ